MTTFMIVMVLLLAAITLVSMLTLKILWSSKVFWALLFVASILLMPVTAGMSPVAMFAIILLRLLILSMAFEKNAPAVK